MSDTSSISLPINELCKPLQKMGITYFAHVRVSCDGGFSMINNHPEFMQHYLKHRYYNADIHMTKKNQFGKYVVWDALELAGPSKKLRRDAADFGIQHLFTIIEQHETCREYFHFGIKSVSKEINHVYLTNLELLNFFIRYFKEKIKGTKWMRLYNGNFDLDFSTGKFLVKNYSKLLRMDKNKFLEDIGIDEKSMSVLALVRNKILTNHLTKRETECIYYYAQGKMAKEIAMIFKISRRTVESYLKNAKEKLGISSKSELVDKSIGCRSQMICQ